MVEKTVLDYLTEQLPGVHVAMEMPETYENPSADRNLLVVIEKTGSSMENHINKSTFAIQSYAGSLYEAAELNELVKSAMFRMISLNQFSKIELNSDYNFTDDSKKQPRYQAVFDLTHY